MLRINIECESKLPVPLQACALFVALEHLLQVTFAISRGDALGFLLDPLAFASNKDFLRTRLFFLARLGEVARCGAWMTANTQLFTT